ncbi:MAG: hypothetical protein K0Q55_2635 [Verrucomicrobia bacterium]|jgi:HEAT repeat protein|nr:hypothetical protein [Verrucomicrobiota bacterium]
MSLKVRHPLLLLLVCALPFLGLSQTPTPASRDQILQHLGDVSLPSRHFAAVQSIQAMGTNAIPFLIEILGYQQSQADQWYEKVYSKAPPSLQSRMSKPEALEKLHYDARLLLRNMPETKQYLTNMVPLLQDPRPVVRRSAAYLLGGMSYQADKTETLVYLSALKDSDPEVRRLIAYAFMDGGASLPRAKAALEGALNDPVEAVRLPVAQALLKADKKHVAATSALKSLFASANASTRYFAATHYFVSDPPLLSRDPEVLQIFISTLAVRDVSLQAAAARTLGNLGDRAKMAVPELQKLLMSPDAQVRTAATNSLQRIAPEVLPPVKP